MTPEHMLVRTQWYENYLQGKGISSKRMHTFRTFGDADETELLAHARHLCDNVRAYAKDRSLWGKANRHYTALQMCLSFANHFTLDDLMNHNKFLPLENAAHKKT